MRLLILDIVNERKKCVSKHFLTIIVPVYNVETYLEKCLDSILAQTYRNFECIVVDDGSSDQSGHICDAYAQKDSRIVVIHQENGGLSAARNTAMEMAKGDLIGFVDGDDAIMPSMYERMIELLDEYQADIAMCDYHSIKGSVGTISGEGVTVWTGREFTERILVDEIGSQLWKFIYRKELWKDIVSPYRRYAEDMWILHRVTYRAKRVVKTDEPLYIYNDTRENNISNDAKNSVKNRIDRALAVFKRIDFCEAYNFNDNIKAKVVNQAIKFLISTFSNERVYERQFHDDVQMLRDYTRKYSRMIKRYGVRKIDIVRSLWIAKNPKSYVTIYGLLRRKSIR